MRVFHFGHSKTQLAGNGHSLVSKALFKSCNAAVAKRTQNPRNGSLYVFCNRASTMIRILSYESNGYYLITKRLSRGRFKHWPKANATMSAVQAHTLRQLLLNTLEPSTPHG